MNIWNSSGDSDLFTLDPNLATALRLTDAGGNQAPPKLSQNVVEPRKKKGSVARQGKNEPFPFVGYRACFGGAGLDVARIVARFRSHAADALRIARPGSRRRLRLKLQTSSSRRPARLPRTRRATSLFSRKVTTSPVPPWRSIPTAALCSVPSLWDAKSENSSLLPRSAVSLIFRQKDKTSRAAVLSPTADCESMCAFVLLGGVQRSVPADARVMVHQIWLGDRRDDPTAASYSAEDLVLVQRDIGRLAQYTAEMGASVDLLDLALRIPPWEPMHALTRDELQRTRLTTEDPEAPAAATVATSSPATMQQLAPRMTNGLHATAISEQRWALVDRSGVATLARRHPLTVEGEEIGSFDLVVACVAGGDGYDVSYIERRHDAEQTPLPDALGCHQVAGG